MKWPGGAEEVALPILKQDGTNQQEGLPRDDDPWASARKLKPERFYLQHAEHVVHALRDSFRVDKYFTPVEETAGRFMTIDAQGSLEKSLKWFWSSTLSVITREATPPCPHTSIACFVPAHNRDVKPWMALCQAMFGERTGETIFLRLRRAFNLFGTSRAGRIRKALSIGQTLLQLKKGSPVISKELREQALVDHRKALEDPVSGVHARNRDRVVEEDVVMDDDIKRELRRTVREVFGRKRFKVDDGGELAPFPSFSGHFAQKRKDAGAAGFVTSLWRRTAEKLLEEDPEPDVETHCVEDSNIYIDRTPGRENDFWYRVWANLMDEDKSGFCSVPLVIPEPLKTRIVTCGPALAYWMCIPLQKFMWTTVKSHPTFELIGQPISEHVMERLGFPSDGKRYCSGDFKSSTDLIRKMVSKTIFREICRVCKVPDWLAYLGRRCLVSHTMAPDRDAEPEEFWSQKNGQLMGSPLSFPILCLANATLARMSFEEKTSRLKDLPVKINGDDCGMIFSSLEYARWSSLGPKFGLYPSIGKCYFSKKFVMLNSEAYQPVTDPLTGLRTMRRVPWVNNGLLRPSSAKGDEPRDFTHLGSISKTFLKGATDEWGPERERLLSVFLYRHGNLLKKAPSGISWFLPKHLGGLGIYCSEKSIASRMTPSQHALASYLHRSHLEGEVPVTFGSWLLQQHPWLKQALRDAPKFLSQTVTFDDTLGFGDWAEMVMLEEDEWTNRQQLEVFAPLLWREASLSYTSTPHLSALEDLDSRALKILKSRNRPKDLKEFEKRGFKSEVGRKLLMDLKLGDIRKGWHRANRTAQGFQDLKPVHELLRSFRITRTLTPFGDVLKRTVRGPRNLLVSSSAPVVEDWSPSPDAVDQLVWLEAFGSLDPSLSTP